MARPKARSRARFFFIPIKMHAIINILVLSTSATYCMDFALNMGDPLETGNQNLLSVYR